MVKIISLFITMMPASAFAFTLARSDFDGGWGGKSLGFYYNSTNCPAGVAAAIDTAMKLWSEVPTSNMKLKLAGSSTVTPAQLVGGTAGQVPVIVCDTAFSTTTPSADPDFVAGYGFFTPAGGRIAYGGIVLNVEGGQNANIDNFSQTDLEILLAHEMGHVLGFGHSEYVPALMYYDISAKSNLNLAQDDIDAMTYLYPRDEFNDGLYGCGRVSQLPPTTGAAALICLLLPLMFLAILRRRASTRYAAA